MRGLDELLDHLEGLLFEIESLAETDRDRVFALLDGVDALHRTALRQLAAQLSDVDLERLRQGHPAVTWLFDAYAVGVDEAGVAEAALEPIRPYIESHGGNIDILDVTEGVVRVKMSGACAGCTASAITLREGVEEALREGFPGFVTIEVQEEEAEPHPPPGPTLLQIEPPTPRA